MRLRLLPSYSFRHSRFALANRITSVLPTILEQIEHLRMMTTINNLGNLDYSQPLAR